MITLPYIRWSKRCRVEILQPAWVWPRWIIGWKPNSYIWTHASYWRQSFTRACYSVLETGKVSNIAHSNLEVNTGQKVVKLVNILFFVWCKTHYLQYFHITRMYLQYGLMKDIGHIWQKDKRAKLGNLRTKQCILVFLVESQTESTLVLCRDAKTLWRTNVSSWWNILLQCDCPLIRVIVYRKLMFLWTYKVSPLVAFEACQRVIWWIRFEDSGARNGRGNFRHCGSDGSRQTVC